ncbi:aminodeoxychorismate lyase [Vibrio maritimus]|uniref:aminodeoxychorismate lyase n=1 Tax=Vibrio maritimus TaxID=990268 RepID=UPI003735C2A7
MFWRNGQKIDHVAVTDRSFQYGDGCFTTILTRYGKLQLWERHVTRMEKALMCLKIAPVDWHALRLEIESHVSDASEAGIKLHVSRGQGGRGYSTKVTKGPFVTVSSFDFPSNYHEIRENGLEVSISDVRLGHNPLLAGLKHNNRLEQILAKENVESSGHLDGIVLDFNGKVIETTMANVFWVNNNQVFTPDLSVAGVAGVMREVVIEELTLLGISVNVGHFDLEDLFAAEEVFVTNCILGVAPITKIREVGLSIGPITKQIQEKLSLC